MKYDQFVLPIFSSQSRAFLAGLHERRLKLSYDRRDQRPKSRPPGSGNGLSNKELAEMLPVYIWPESHGDGLVGPCRKEQGTVDWAEGREYD